MKAHRFAFLDGLRGVAAIFVLTRHTTAFWHEIPNRSYLAVDLFFALSGFVIAYAYDERLRMGQIGVFEFLKLRVIRLYPVYFLGVVLSLIAGLLGFHPHISSRPEMAIALGFALFMLPSALKGSTLLFTLNIATWSLLLELLANWLYAAVRKWLSDRALLTVAIVGGLALLAVALRTNSLNIGFNWTQESLIGGPIRAIYGISMGLIIHRYRNAIFPRLEWAKSAWCTVCVTALLVAFLACPPMGRWDGFVDAAFAIAVSPLIVVLGAQATSSRLDPLYLALGSASYPVYVLHIPISCIVLALFSSHVAAAAPWSGVAFVAILVPLTVGLERAYDIPVRRWLTRKAFPARTA